MAIIQGPKSDPLLGICFLPRRAGNGPGVGRCRRARGGKMANDECGMTNRGATAAPHGRFLGLKCDRRGIDALVSLFASMPLPSASPSTFLAADSGLFGLRLRTAGALPALQSPSRTRMEPSSSGISTGFPFSERWSNQSDCAGISSSGIPSRIACQGGAMGSKV